MRALSKALLVLVAAVGCTGGGIQDEGQGVRELMMPALGSWRKVREPFVPWLHLGGEVGECEQVFVSGKRWHARVCVCGETVCQLIIVVSEKELPEAREFAGTLRSGENVTVTEGLPARGEASDRLLRIELSDVVERWKENEAAKAAENKAKCLGASESRKGRPPRVEGITREVADGVVRKNVARMHTCMEMQALLSDGCLGGTLRLQWRVTKGRVREVEVVEDAMTSPEFVKCATTAVRSFRFPAESSGTAEYSWEAASSTDKRAGSVLQLVLGP